MTAWQGHPLRWPNIGRPELTPRVGVSSATTPGALATSGVNIIAKRLVEGRGLTAVPDSGGENAPEPVPRPDGELWRRASRGDEAAFTELFHRHAEAVWNHAYRLSGSWATAEDVTSSTFVTAWSKCGAVTLANESARPWLFAVAANIARTHGRGERRLLRLRRSQRPETAHDHADDVADRMANESRLRRVVAAVGGLPKAQRKAAELCLLGDLSFAEAAAVLGVAEATVRSQISRARARLRAVLEES